MTVRLRRAAAWALLVTFALGGMAAFTTLALLQLAAEAGWRP